MKMDDEMLKIYLDFLAREKPTETEACAKLNELLNRYECDSLEQFFSFIL